MIAGDRKGGEGATLGAMLARTVARRPSACAIVAEGEALDWTAFAGRSESLAAQLAATGIGRGDRVALWLPNGALYLAAIFAVARLGAIAIHVNTRVGASEIDDLLARTRPRVLVTHHAPAIDAAAILARIPPEHIASVETIIGPGHVPPIVSGGSHPDVGSPDDPCLVYTTGGTTAQPKLVVHTQRSIAVHAGAVAVATGLDAPDAAYLAAVPFCGTFGNVGAMAAVAGGASIVAMAAFDPAAADALMRAHGITHALGDDRMIDRLAAEAATPHDTIRFFGAAAFGADAAPALARGRAAGLEPRAIYGSSEAQALFAIGEVADGGLGAVTPLAKEARAEIVEGELRLSGPSLFDHYLGDPVATTAAIEDGLFRTGDRATPAGDGFVFEGRMGDVLRLGGFLVSPLEIEAFLVRQPGIVEAQVVAVEGVRGATPVAFAIAEGVVDEAAIIGAARASLARYKVPARVIAIAAFPTSTGPNGPKISRAELRRMAHEVLAAPSLERKLA